MKQFHFPCLPLANLMKIKVKKYCLVIATRESRSSWHSFHRFPGSRIRKGPQTRKSRLPKIYKPPPNDSHRNELSSRYCILVRVVIDLYIPILFQLFEGLPYRVERVTTHKSEIIIPHGSSFIYSW